MPPPRKPQFEDEDETSSGSEETSSEEEEEQPAIKARAKFDDEEDDSDVVDDWEAEDSDAEREKAKKEAEAKAKAAAAAAASKKSKTQRIEDHKKANAARRAAEDEDDDSSDDEDEADRRVRLKAAQRDADLRHAEDLFGNVQVSREKTAPKTLVSIDPADPTKMADLSEMAFFRPSNKSEFEYMREKLTVLIGSNAKKPQYTLFLQEFAKQLAKDLPSDQIKKVASSLTTLSNEKMKEEKSTDKGGKKSKAAKTKTSLVASRNVATRADVEVYDDGLDEDDFM